MKHYLLFIFLIFLRCSFAQTTPQKTDIDLIGSDSLASEEVIATFKSTRIVNAQSVQTVGKGVLDLRIMHRFGAVNTGLYQLYGLDNASMRIGFEYGITKDLMIGLGRNTIRKTYDGFLKYKLIKQTVGSKKNIPFTLTCFTSAAFNTFRYNTPRDQDFVGKWDFVSELLIGRKINEEFSVQLMPVFVHRNLVETTPQKNNLTGMGIGGRYKFTHALAINFDYYYISSQQLGIKDGKALYSNPLSIGIDIETGGHVFQLHFTNSNGLIEKQFIGETTGSWIKGDVLFGFNLSRVFTIQR